LPQRKGWQIMPTKTPARPVTIKRALITSLTDPAGLPLTGMMTGPTVETTASAAATENPRCTDPVFVLFCARSGSTLLRFLLDTHPDLACPPETNLAAACTQLANIWSLLADTPDRPDPDGTPTELPEPALAGMRQSLDLMIGPYLARRGKTRYCDKSLTSTENADLLVQLFPGAKFVCLYRHPMDVIASGMEACPWGLKGFGFDSYAAQYPGNSVQAIAQCWADRTSANLAVEQRLPDRCFRVRYEDLVADPEAVAQALFSFLGVSAQPGITLRCFTPERERGRGDFKIWHTSRISTDSVGRGWSIPPYELEPAVTSTVNSLAEQLGYVQINGDWGAADTPPDLRTRTHDGQPISQPTAGPEATREIPRTFLLLGEHLQAGLFRISDNFTRRWGAAAGETFLVTATAADTSNSARWRVDLAARSVTLASGNHSSDITSTGATWQVTGHADIWEQVIQGKANLNVALRRRDLRYSSTTETPGGPTRISMLADLLAITSWRPAQPIPHPSAIH
jgi:Sulfotransferase family